jgi:multidrug transporter EmrE-like cation transporter
MAKNKDDFIDSMIKSVNWKIGNFNFTPVVFGGMMAVIDLFMMGTAKMVNKGTMSTALGIPFAIGLYAFQPLVFMKAMRYEGMIVANLVWNLMSNIMVTLQGVFVFGETIKGLRTIGVLMSLFSITLLAYTDNN